MTHTALSGLLLVDKPSGPTSYDMIRWVKRTLKGAKIGHCGTLDPLASGLLILLFGSATRQQSRFMGHDKIYEGTLRLGVKTDSADTMGHPVEQKEVPDISEQTCRNALLSFVGTQTQIPPMFSALKKDGQPLYKLARKGESVERPSRMIDIKKMEFLGRKVNDISFRVECSTGTYVRTLAEDIAAKLNTVGTLAALRRVGIGPFDVGKAVDGERLKTMTPEQIKALIMTVEG